jgi:hypothetical protein
MRAQWGVHGKMNRVFTPYHFPSKKHPNRPQA